MDISAAVLAMQLTQAQVQDSVECKSYSEITQDLAKLNESPTAYGTVGLRERGLKQVLFISPDRSTYHLVAVIPKFDYACISNAGTDWTSGTVKPEEVLDQIQPAAQPPERK